MVLYDFPIVLLFDFLGGDLLVRNFLWKTSRGNCEIPKFGQTFMVNVGRYSMHGETFRCFPCISCGLGEVLERVFMGFQVSLCFWMAPQKC